MFSFLFIRTLSIKSLTFVNKSIFWREDYRLHRVFNCRTYIITKVKEVNAKSLILPTQISAPISCLPLSLQLCQVLRGSIPHLVRVGGSVNSCITSFICYISRKVLGRQSFRFWNNLTFTVDFIKGSNTIFFVFLFSLADIMNMVWQPIGYI